MKVCYYALLGVTASASETDLKKAYRRKALELHPDRNIDNVEETTKLFAEVQHAYEILSDPGERRWYDSHKYEILRDDEDESSSITEAQNQSFFSYFRGTKTNASKYTSQFSGGFTTTAKVMSMFSKSVPPVNFLEIYEDFFLKLWDEELNSYSYDKESLDTGYGAPPKYPSGPLRGDVYPKQWYDHWLSFSSIKSYAWLDQYKLQDAQDRYVRRRMEKENKRIRDQARREFNDSVRQLAGYVRKRDKRFVIYKREQKQLAEERVRAINKDTKVKKQEQQTKLAEEYVAPSWAEAKNEDSDGNYSPPPDDDLINHDLYCVVCDVEFKTKTKLNSHIETKKHLNKLEKLRQELLEDEGLFQEEKAKFSTKEDKSFRQRPEQGQEENKFSEEIANQEEVEEPPEVPDKDYQIPDLEGSEFGRSSIASSLNDNKKKKKKKKKGNLAADLDIPGFAELDSNDIGLMSNQPSVFSLVNDPSIILEGTTPSNKKKNKKKKERLKKKALEKSFENENEDLNDVKNLLHQQLQSDSESKSEQKSVDNEDEYFSIENDPEIVQLLSAESKESLSNDEYTDSEAKIGVPLSINGSSQQKSQNIPNSGLSSEPFSPSVSNDASDESDGTDQSDVDWSGKNVSKTKNLKKKKKQQLHNQKQQEHIERKKKEDEAKKLREEKEQRKRERIQKKREGKNNDSNVPPNRPSKSSERIAVTSRTNIFADIEDIPDPDEM